MKFLIVGVNSLLGSALGQALSNAGHSIIGTERITSGKNNHLQFDLSSSSDAWPDWPENIDSAFIAAAVTSQENCTNDPKYAQFINVTQTLLLIEQLRCQGVHIVYPSTNLVLPCTEPQQSIDTEYGPIGSYGESKAEVEQAVHPCKDVTIARLPKILDKSGGILRNWSRQLKNSEQISVFTNLKVSPVSLAYCTDFLLQLMVRQMGGIWHLSGAEDISYAEVAKAFITSVGYSPDAETLLEYSQMDMSKGALPAHPGLDCSKTRQVLGIVPQKLNDIFK